MKTYAEYLVTRKKNIFDYITIALAVFAGASATFALFPCLFLPAYGMLTFLGMAGIWFVVYIIIATRTVEFEYCVTENILDVDMITGKKKRKKYVSIDLKEAEIIAPAAEKYGNDYRKEGIVNKYSASMFDAEILDFFVLYRDEKHELSRLVFTPNQEILDMIRRANPSRTFFE